MITSTLVVTYNIGLEQISFSLGCHGVLYLSSYKAPGEIPATNNRLQCTAFEHISVLGFPPSKYQQDCFNPPRHRRSVSFHRSIRTQS